MLSLVRNRVFVLIFFPITLDFNFESWIKSILISVFRYLFLQKFQPNLLVKFSANLDPNSVIFDFVDSPSIIFLKI